MIKRIISLLLTVLLLTALLTACGGTSLSGTYTDTATGMTSFVFEKGKASTSVMGINTPLGDYKVKGNDLYIGDVKAGTVKGDTITITMVGFSAEYKKQ